MNKQQLNDITPDSVDDGYLTDLKPLIVQLTEFLNQFSTHSMNNSGAAFLQGKKQAYIEIIDFLKNASPVDFD